MPNASRRTYSRPLLIFVFFLLYIYQGLQFGLNEAFKQILKAKHLPDSELSWLGLSSSPFYLKFLIAPFMDVFFSRKFGKRFTWIVPTAVLSSSLYFLTAGLAERWVEEKDVFSLFLINFGQMLLIATQDVAIDGMVCEVLNPEDYEKGSLMQTLGQMVGPMLSCNVFNLLVSKEFALKHFAMDTSLVSISGYIRMMGCFVLASTAFSYFAVREGAVTSAAATGEEHKELSFSELVRLIPKMAFDGHIRNLLIIPLLFDTFLIFTDSSSFLKLIDKGFDLVFINEFELWFAALDLLLIFGLSKLNILDNIWRIYRLSQNVLFANAVLFWLFFYFVSLDEHRALWIVFLVAYKIVRYLSLVKFTAGVVFIQYMADKSYGGSYLTITFSAHNFFNMNTSSLLLKTTQFFGFDSVLLAVLAYDSAFRLFFRQRWIDYFHSSKPQMFALKKLKSN